MNFRQSNYYLNEEIKIFLLENQNLFGEKLLDFGCGDFPYRDYIDSVSAYQGVDLFENKNNENYKKIELGRKLPFDNESYNSIISTQVIYQLEDLNDHTCKYMEGHPDEKDSSFFGSFGGSGAFIEHICISLNFSAVYRQNYIIR